MCGIGAILRITPAEERHEPIPEQWLDTLDEGVAWRGQDGAGRFRDSMTRPDGTVVEVALVHRRLAIIDLEGGVQPMVQEAHDCPACAAKLAEISRQRAIKAPGHGVEFKASGGRLAVVFNGCIYNHREVRAELESKGHVFRTDHSDTEVILHSCTEWNDEFANLELDDDQFPNGWRIEGMYAFVIWDGIHGEAWCGRDRRNEKPLFEARIDKHRTHILASTPGVIDVVRRMVEGPALPAKRMNRDVVIDSVALGFSNRATPLRHIENAAVLFQQVGRFDESVHLPLVRRAGNRVVSFIIGTVFTVLFFSVCAGMIWGLHLLVSLAFGFLISTGLIWVVLKLPIPWVVAKGVRTIRQRNRQQPSAEIEIEQLLELSVANRIEADVPLGCFLSGGVDSSLISLMASRHLPQLRTLTVRMPDRRYDESHYAEMVADHLGTRHMTLDCDGSAAADDLVRLIRAVGLPFGDSSILPTYWLCREARKHVKVALAGDGGDELFYGYDRYRASRYLWWPKRTLIGLLPTGRLDRSDPKSLDERKARLITSAGHGGYLDLLAIFPTPDRRALFGRARGTFAGRHYLESSARAMRTFDESHYLPGDLLRKVDTASMLAGVEVRCPFLSTDIEIAADRIPARIHMRHGEGKHILKQIARKYLPPQVIDRPKQGFAIPISEWWRSDFGGLGTLMMERLSRERPFGVVHEDLPIKMDFVRQMIDEHRVAGGLSQVFTARYVKGRDHGQRLFALVSLSIWADTLT